jgi:hypothetical protein
MTTCITINANYLDPHSIYPVFDPRRTAGPGPYSYGYAFAWDAVGITVERTPTLSSCQMAVNFSSTLTEAKEIQGWNFFNNAVVDRIGSASLALPPSMTLRRAWGPGQSCSTGADTVILCRYFAWPRGRTALYTFEPQDFWDFWGGCTVTFNWFSDTQGSGLWGDQTPSPTYPAVKLPDRTLMRNAAGTGFIVVLGGAGFAADSAFVGIAGFNTSAALPFSALPSLPADRTLVREINRPEVFVVFGGAKFWIPDWATGFSLYRHNFLKVSVIPPGGTAQLRSMPIDGTLIKEQHDPKVYFVDQGQLRWVTSPGVMDAKCFPWRHVRTVPDRALAALARGPNL